MIPVFLPTKNRAMQLKLLLDSVAENTDGLYRFYIRYNYTNDDYLEGYKKLQRDEINDKLDIKWVHEPDFFKDMDHFLENEVDDIFCLYTDDCVMFRPIDIKPEDVDEFLNVDVFSFNLRLGYNTTTQNYITNQQQYPLMPDFEMNNALFWDFNKYPLHHNYGYPFTWDGGFFRKSTLKPILDKAEFNRTDYKVLPTQQVESFVINHADLINEKYISCLNDSSVVCISCNITHNQGDNFGKLHKYELDELNNLYLGGSKIDYHAIDFSDITSSHIEKPFEFIED